MRRRRCAPLALAQAAAKVLVVGGELAANSSAQVQRRRRQRQSNGERDRCTASRWPTCAVAAAAAAAVSDVPEVERRQSSEHLSSSFSFGPLSALRCALPAAHCLFGSPS